MQEAFERDLMILLHDVARMLRTRADRAARAHGMTRAQWIILARLARQPGQSQNELAAVCDVEPITIGRLVDRLEARGLVERCPDPSDRRVRRLRLLPSANPIVREITSYRNAINDEIVATLSPEMREPLIDSLRRIKDYLAADGANCPKAELSRG